MTRMDHAAGDTALCTIVACIQKYTAEGCHLYRTGGDEFMILCSRVSKDDVPALIDHMRGSLRLFIAAPLVLPRRMQTRF